MKTIIIAVAILLAGTASYAQTSDTTKVHTHRVTNGKHYTCTMHPEVVRAKPGKCPKCGMKLVAMKKMKKGDMKHDKFMGNMKM